MAGNGPGRGEWADERRSRSVRDEDLGFDRALEPGREDRGGGQGRSRAAGAGGSDQQGRAAALDVSPTGGSPTGPSHLQHLPHCAEPVPGQEVQVYVQEGLGGSSWSRARIQHCRCPGPRHESSPPRRSERPEMPHGAHSFEGRTRAGFSPMPPGLLATAHGRPLSMRGALHRRRAQLLPNGKGTGARPASGQNAWHSHPHKAIVDWSRSADRNSRTPIRTCPHC